MRMKVQLYVAGKTFYEYMEAVDYSHARQIALARNPGATVIGCNADYSSDNNSGGGFFSSSSSSSSNVSRSVGTNNSGEGSAVGLGGLIFLGLLAMALSGISSIFGDDETPKTKQYNNSQAPQIERTYTPSAPPVVQQSQSRGWSYVRPSSDNFFTNSGIQEEAIDDLGQDWDN